MAKLSYRLCNYLSPMLTTSMRLSYPSGNSCISYLRGTFEVRLIRGLREISVRNENRGRCHNKKVVSEDLDRLSNHGHESRLLKIAVIGVPNVGKSTVINQLVGRRVCSISSKVHTTRCKARAIAVDGNTQLVFLDTPGLVNSDESHRHHLERAFHTDGEEALLEADVIGVIHDVSNNWTRDRLDPKVLRLLHLYPRKHSFLILNKIDALKSKRKLLDIIRLLTNGSLAGQQKELDEDSPSIINYTADTDEEHKVGVENQQLSELQVKRKVKTERGWSHFEEVFMVSALMGDGIKDVKDYLLHIAEPSPWLFPASQFTDQPSETVVIDTVRAKLLDYLPQEVPYNLVTSMEYFETSEDGKITAIVRVDCPSLHLEKLVVGLRGRRIRIIAREAEQELQSTFRQHLILKVVVTSKEGTVVKKEKLLKSSR
ncbi:GTPase Era, mitochondrial [Periplaneta americana]|uniref:GTPase Era, mitochondrial n=1 Tax=Periplaneta americana TaxID=6978 RepID=UPI0037E7F135